MAKRRATTRKRKASSGSKRASGHRRALRGKATKAAKAKTKRTVRAVARTNTGTSKVRGVLRKASRLDRARRTLEETVPTPPSSLNMDRHGSAARSGRAGLEDSLQKHGSITPAITGGDIDADWQDAYFTGEEAPGGDNPTPDQDIVDDIGKALGVEYQDSEELKSSDKVVERDKHRWELDPASSEDYKERK